MGTTTAPAAPAETEYDATKGVYFEKTKSSKYMTDKELSELPLLARINWLSTSIIFTPLIGLLIGVYFVPLQYNTFVLSFVQYVLTGLGITAGYHRLFSHRAYHAAAPVEYVLLAWGAAAFEGSARWWSRNHRAHHRYVDSERDPYSVHKGFWYAHVGWMVLKQDSRRAGRVDISDLNAHERVMFQHRNYLPIALFFGFVLPLGIAHIFWGDFWGALVYACFGRMFFVHQATFCINSLAHTFGNQTYSKEHSSFDSILTALITFGEGYHNFHHEFPHDYRNGIRWYHYDPTKWVIRFLSWFRLCTRLIRFPGNEIEKARIQVMQQELDERKAKIDWGQPIESLLPMTWATVERRVNEGETLIVIEGLVHKLDDFISQHPGGPKILEFWNGRDATQAFNGEVYRHSKGARNLLAHFRIATLEEKLE
jgi:stearoyl-CoA desaturase (delta-9 desaturase)